MMRVLLVGAVSGTPGVGGVAHVQRRLAAALTDLGVEVIQLFRTGQRYLFVRGVHADASSVFHEASGLVAAKSKLDELRPDVVHVTFAMTPLASLVAAWARRSHIPLVAHPEGALDSRFLAHHRLRKYPYLATIERPLRHAEAVVSVTEGDLGDNSRWFGRTAEHFIIPNIVDPPAFVDASEPSPTATPPPSNGIYFGRINDYHKGITRLIDLARQTPDLRYTLVGAVDQSDQVAVDALADLPANVEFVGAFQGDELYRRVAAADFFIHPARFEAFGNTIPEALSVGCPVIVSQETYLAHTLAAREFGHVIDFSDASVAAAELRRHLARPEELRRRTVAWRGVGARRTQLRRSWPFVRPRLRVRHRTSGAGFLGAGSARHATLDLVDESAAGVGHIGPVSERVHRLAGFHRTSSVMEDTDLVPQPESLQLRRHRPSGVVSAIRDGDHVETALLGDAIGDEAVEPGLITIVSRPHVVGILCPHGIEPTVEPGSGGIARIEAQHAGVELVRVLEFDAIVSGAGRNDSVGLRQREVAGGGEIEDVDERAPDRGVGVEEECLLVGAATENVDLLLEWVQRRVVADVIGVEPVRNRIRREHGDGKIGMLSPKPPQRRRELTQVAAWPRHEVDHATRRAATSGCLIARWLRLEHSRRARRGHYSS